MSTGLKIYEKQTAASRGKQVNRGDTQSPEQKAVENKHNPGWFARPQKFTEDRPTTTSQVRSQRGMNHSHVRSNEGGQGQSERYRNNQIFNDEDYRDMVDNDESSEQHLRPESPYHIPEQAKMDLESHIVLHQAQEGRQQLLQDSDKKNQKHRGVDTPAFHSDFNRDGPQQQARHSSSEFDAGLGGIKPYQSAGSGASARFENDMAGEFDREDLLHNQKPMPAHQKDSFGPNHQPNFAQSSSHRNSFAQAASKPPNQLRPRANNATTPKLSGAKAGGQSLLKSQRSNLSQQRSLPEEQGSTRARRTSSNMGGQNAAARRRSPAGPNPRGSSPQTLTNQSSKEAEYIKKKLGSYQNDVISICQEYDTIVAKQVKSRTDYQQSEQFNLIKKAVSTITCLEDLVSIALTKMESAGKEVGEALDKLSKTNRQNEYFREQLGYSEPGLEDTVRQLSYDLKDQVDASLNRNDGDGHLSQLRYRISSQVLTDVDGLVEKVAHKRYDSALLDTLSALVTIYGDHDPIQVKQEDNGALNIEVKSQPGADNIYDDQFFKKSTPAQSVRGGTKRQNRVGHGKSTSSGNEDIAFVSPISSNRNRDVNNVTKDSYPGDETKEFANMVVQETSRKPNRVQGYAGNRRGSRSSAQNKKGDTQVLDSKKSKGSGSIAFGRTMTKAEKESQHQSAKKLQSQTPVQLSKQGSDDLQQKKQAIHDVYRQYAQMKQIRDGKRTADPQSINKVQSQKVFAQSNQSAPGKKSQAKEESKQRKMGLITTQLLNEGGNSAIKPTKSVVSKHEQSQRESKLSVYTDNALQFETRTEDGRKTVGQASAILTDTNINLFNNQSSQQQHAKRPAPYREVPQVTNHQVRAARTPNSHKLKQQKHVASSLPASRREQDSLIDQSNSHGKSRASYHRGQVRAQSLNSSTKETPKSSTRKKPPVNSQKTLESFYAGAKDTARGGVNNLFSPVLSNMHKGGGVQVNPNVFKQSKNDSSSQQTLKISSKQRPTKVVNPRRSGYQRGSPSKHDALITPVLSQQKDNPNSSIVGKPSPRRPATSINQGQNAQQANAAHKNIEEEGLILDQMELSDSNNLDSRTEEDHQRYN